MISFQNHTFKVCSLSLTRRSFTSIDDMYRKAARRTASSTSHSRSKTNGTLRIYLAIDMRIALESKHQECLKIRE